MATATTTTTTTAAAAAAAAPPAPDLTAQLAALITDLTGKVAALEAKIATQQTAAPRFKAMAPPDLHNATARRTQVMRQLKAGESASGVTRYVPVTVDGQRVPARFGPTYAIGDLVRVNPDVAREGWPAGQTWGDVLAREGCEGLGEVKRVLWLDKAGLRWKYKVRVPGLTKSEGDGFYDDELLDAV